MKAWTTATTSLPAWSKTICATTPPPCAAEARAQQIKSVAEQKAAELKSGFQDKADDFKVYADDALGQAKEQYEKFMGEAETMAREKPRQALLTAFGVGLFVGLLLRR